MFGAECLMIAKLNLTSTYNVGSVHLLLVSNKMNNIFFKKGLYAMLVL